MHILLFAHFAGSPHHGMVYGHYYLAREWVKAGHSVTIVAASFAHTRMVQPDQQKRICSEWIDGIRYIWIPTPTYRASNWPGRVRNILSYTWKTRWGNIPLEKADLVICSSHHPTPIYAAHKYVKRFEARLVFEVRDLWPLSLIEMGGASKINPFIWWLQRAEDYAYKHSHKVVAVMPEAHRYMYTRGMNPNKFVHIPNGIDPDSFLQKEPLPKKHVQKMDDFAKGKRLIIGYAGRIGMSNAMNVAVEALARCNDQKIGLVLLGNGSHLKTLRNQVIALNLEKQVLFLPPVIKSQVPAFLNRIDVAYLGLQSRPLFRFGVSPTKLNDFMMAAKPIIYAVEAPGNVVEESGAGITCKPDDSEALSNAIHVMQSLDGPQREAMGKKGKYWILANRKYSTLAQTFLQKVFE